MSALRHLSWLFVAGAFGGMATAGRALVYRPAPGLTDSRHDPARAPTPHSAEAVPAVAIGLAARRLARAVPFRQDRLPTAVAYVPWADTLPPPPPPVRPALAVTGILWATHPVAIIEGIPGTTGGRLLGIRDTLGGLKVARITAAQVVLVGYDTAWTLTVRHSWQ